MFMLFCIFHLQYTFNRQPSLSYKWDVVAYRIRNSSYCIRRAMLLHFVFQVLWWFPDDRHVFTWTQEKLCTIFSFNIVYIASTHAITTFLLILSVLYTENKRTLFFVFIYMYILYFVYQFRFYLCNYVLIMF